MSEPRPVVIVGAGLAGLCCALKLQESNVPFVILEASDRIGGRVGTDLVQGFQLDRGLQLFYTAYPEAKRILNYEALHLHKLSNAVLVCFGGKLHKASDPFRDPITAIPNPFSPIGTVPDKVKASLLRQQIVGKSIKEIFEEKESQTKAALHEQKFSESMINRFFQPFLSTVFLEKDLRTSSKMFEFMFSMIANGSIALPAKGMQAIPNQIASKLPQERIITQVRVTAVSDYYLQLDTGDEIDAAAVVVATDGPDASLLLRDLPKPRTHSVTTVYFEAPKPPVTEPSLVLNGEGYGRINCVSVPSLIAPSYAPPGKTLVAVTALGEPYDSESTANTQIKSELEDWFKEDVQSWRLIKMYRISHAVPDQSPPQLSRPERAVKFRPGMYICGDHRDNATMNGAMVSGRRAAESVLEDLKYAAQLK
jgi:phytoene dehydrogenase-like protein